jgi:hypothetical protein
VISSAFDVPGPGSTYSFPLPVKNQSYVNIVYNMADSGTVQAVFFNEAGDEVIQFSETKIAGLQSSSVFLCCLSPGLYFYKVTLTYNSGTQEKLSVGKILVRS